MKKRLIPPAVILVFGLLLVGISMVSAQGSPPPTPAYVGSDKCLACHPAEHASWAASLHPRMIQDPKKTPTMTLTINGVPLVTNTIRADFALFTQVITDAKLKYTAKDVIFTIGWRYRQQYVLQDPKTKRLVLGAGQWNMAGEGPTASDNQWQMAPGGLDWLNQCAGCHTTGLNLAAAQKYKVGDKVLPYVETGVGCEACHGPGGNHIAAPSQNNIPVNRSQALNADICGQCHTRGSSPEVNGIQHGYPISYTVGEPLTAKSFIPIQFTALVTDTNWWSDGHAKKNRLQYLEWSASGHAKTLETLKKAGGVDACLSCHSADYIAATALIQAGQTGVVTPTFKTAQFAITCQVCHAPHQKGAQPFDMLLRNERYRLCVTCHNGTAGGTRPLTPGAQAHSPTQEMFEGKGALNVEGVPSAHWTAPQGPRCVSCHMPGTATSADPGDLATHNWKIVMPGKAEATQPNACSACHTQPTSSVQWQASAAELQKLIDSRQKEIKDKMAALNKRFKDVRSAHPEWDPKAEKKSEQQIAYETALTNVSFVESDGSYGLHNYEYAQAILTQAEAQLKIAAATPTPTPTLVPTATPEPTPTPFILPPTATPVPPPSGGSGWPVWGITGVIILVLIALLVLRKPPAN